MITQTRTRPALGTYITITSTGDEPQNAIDLAFETIYIIEEKTSFFRPNSDVTAINTLAPHTHLEINHHTFIVLATALELSRMSHGVFDITIGSKLIKEKFLPSDYPPDFTGTWQDITLTEDAKVILKKPVCIDLGGIAKGYAVDEAIKTLQKEGMLSGVVNAGGDIRCFGEEMHPLHIRHPIHPDTTCYLGDLLCNNAVATSAGYYSRQHTQIPIVNPITQSCINTYDSVSIIASSCITADALTKIVLIDPHHADTILTYFNARALLLRYDAVTQQVHVFDSHSTLT